MRKEPLEYQSITRGENRPPQVKFQTIVSCSLLGVAVLCAAVGLVWSHHRSEFFAAAISLAAGGLVVLLPFRRM